MGSNPVAGDPLDPENIRGGNVMRMNTEGIAATIP